MNLVSDNNYNGNSSWLIVNDSYYYYPLNDLNKFSKQKEEKECDMYKINYNVYKNNKVELFVFVIPGFKKEDVKLMLGKKGIDLRLKAVDPFVKDYDVVKKSIDIYGDGELSVFVPFDKNCPYDLDQADFVFADGLLKVYLPYNEDNSFKEVEL